MLLAILALALTLFFWARCTQVLHGLFLSSSSPLSCSFPSTESLLVFPTLGIQLSTYRGHPLLPTYPLQTTHHFIPLAALEDVVIHEGLHGWNVRYYLAALQRRRVRQGGGGSRIEVHVAFEVRPLSVQLCLEFTRAEHSSLLSSPQSRLPWRATNILSTTHADRRGGTLWLIYQRIYAIYHLDNDWLITKDSVVRGSSDTFQGSIVTVCLHPGYEPKRS